ncbi:MAG: ABC transporter substrate-binding protein [Alphaproteobacteria bacterium]|nr:ABC transporter substrate-binding protein [Alphaproteobacteria bacterium]
MKLTGTSTLTGGALAAAALLLLASPMAAQEKTLRVAATSLPASGGNPFGAGIFPAWHTWTTLFDAMTVVDTDGSVKAQVAVAWKNVDATTWQFSLRPNVKFDNGEPLDAAAVAASFDWLLNDDKGKVTNVARGIPEVASVRAIDALTLEVKTKAADAIQPGRLSSVLLVAPKAWKDLGLEGYSRAPVGSGSFKVRAWTPEKVALQARSDSWRPPKVSTLEIVPIAERQPRVQALVSNQVDIAVSLSLDNVGEIEKAGHKADVVSSSTVSTIAMINTKDGSPFKDKRVRQALNYAVNKEAIAKNLYAGRAKVATQGATPNTFGYDPAKQAYPFDRARAKALLAEAGTTSLRFTTEVVVGAFAGDSEMFQQVAQDLTAVGVSMDLRPIPSSDWIRKFATGAWDGPAFGSGQNSQPYNDASRWLVFNSCRKPSPYFCDEGMVAAIDRSNMIFDVAERRKTLGDLLTAERELAPYILLIENIEVVGVNRRLANFRNTGKSFNYDGIAVD